MAPGIASAILGGIDAVGDGATAPSRSDASEHSAPAPDGVQFDGPGFVPQERQIESTSSLPPADPNAKPMRELFELRTDASQVFENSDGTRTLKAFDTPRFYKTDVGTFEAIDNTIVPDKDHPGELRNTAGAWSVRFAPIRPDGTGGVLVARGGKPPVRMFPGFAQLPKDGIVPEAGTGEQANTVWYRDVAPGIDLEYVVSGEGVKENIVLKTRPKTGEFTFDIEGEGFAARADGVLEPTGENKGNWQISPAVVTDRAGQPKGNRDAKPSQRAAATTGTAGATTTTDPATTDTTVAPDATTTTTTIPDKDGAAEPLARSTVTVAVDSTWLASLADRDFPIVVDPTITDTGGDHQAFGSTGWTPGLNAYGVENFAGNHTQGYDEYWRSFRVFPSYSTAFGGTVTNAHIDVAEL